MVSHDPSEIVVRCWFAAQETLTVLIWNSISNIINVFNVTLINLMQNKSINFLNKMLYWPQNYEQ